MCGGVKYSQTHFHIKAVGFGIDGQIVKTQGHKTNKIVTIFC